MARQKMTPEDIQRVLSGSAVDGRNRPLAVFVSDVRRTFTAPVDPFVRERHLGQMAEAFADRSPQPARRRPVARPAFSRVLVAAACFVGGVMALAAAGTLPGPMQGLVARSVAFTGLDLPGASDEPDKGGHDAPQGEAGKQRAASNRARAEAFTSAKKEWTSCVHELAKTHDDGDFDPEAEPPAGCGQKPHPSDFRETTEEAEDAVPTANPGGHVPGSGNADEGLVEDDASSNPKTKGLEKAADSANPNAPHGDDDTGD